MATYELDASGHRRRLRERFDKSAAGWHGYELVELLLTYAVPRRDMKPVAKTLIGRFGGVAGILGATPEELQKIDGLGSAGVTLIKLVHAINCASLSEPLMRRDALRSPRAVVDFARAKIAGLPHEAFLAIFVSVQNELRDWAVVNEGTVDQVAVYPRRIIELAVARRAAGLILAHNHPSGYTVPSEEDKRLTRTIRDAASLFDVRVIDHVVVGNAGYFSFSENGLL